MPNTISNFFAPVRPYDTSTENNFTMYDNMPYNRDIGVCGNDMIKMSTGNVVKFYRLDKVEPRYIDNSNVPILETSTPLTGFVETTFQSDLEEEPADSEAEFSHSTDSFNESHEDEDLSDSAPTDMNS